ncbi:MAG: hypothetical protein WCJ29_01335 [bacterium]
MLEVLLIAQILTLTTDDVLPEVIDLFTSGRKIQQHGVTRMMGYAKSNESRGVAAKNSDELRKVNGDFRIHGNLFCEPTKVKLGKCKANSFGFTGSIEPLRYLTMSEESYLRGDVVIWYSLWHDEAAQQIYLGVSFVFTDAVQPDPTFTGLKTAYDLLLDIKTMEQRAHVANLILEIIYGHNDKQTIDDAWRAFGSPFNVFNGRTIRFTEKKGVSLLVARKKYKNHVDEILDQAPVAIGGYFGRFLPGESHAFVGYESPEELLADLENNPSDGGTAELLIALDHDDARRSIIITVHENNSSQDTLEAASHRDSLPLVAYIRLPMTNEREGAIAQDVVSTLIEGPKLNDGPALRTVLYNTSPIQIGSVDGQEETSVLSWIASLAIILTVIIVIWRDIARRTKKPLAPVNETKKLPEPVDSAAVQAAALAERERKLEERRRRQEEEAQALANKNSPPAPEPPITLADIKPLRDRLVKYLEDPDLSEEARETYEFQLRRADEEDRLPRKKKFFEYAVSRMPVEEPEAENDDSEQGPDSNPSQTA